MSIVEIFLILIVALIVIPPEHLPEVMRTAGKLMRELRLASNTVLRELSGAIEEPPAYRAEPPPPACQAEQPPPTATTASGPGDEPPAQS